jgi:asparagine N-glycosylation enzyme membrane subunit Stt3
MKKALFFITALVLQIGSPILAVFLQGETLFKQSGVKSFTTFGMLIIIMLTPLLSKLLEGKAIRKPTVTKGWAVIFILVFFLSSISTELLWISMAGIVGNIIADQFYVAIDNINKAKERELTAKEVAKQIKG